jgi:hypothetical protein
MAAVSDRATPLVQAQLLEARREPFGGSIDVITPQVIAREMILPVVSTALLVVPGVVPLLAVS